MQPVPHFSAATHRPFPPAFTSEARNQGMLFPYEFIRSKYEPYFFWAW
jgi:hypothetical protein